MSLGAHLGVLGFNFTYFKVSVRVGASGEGLLQGWVFGVQGSGFHSPSGDTEGVTTAPGLCCFLGHYFVHFSGIHRDLFLRNAHLRF